MTKSLRKAQKLKVIKLRSFKIFDFFIFWKNGAKLLIGFPEFETDFSLAR